MKLLRRRQNKNLQYEFLPSALEIIETPSSPFGRIIIWLILALLAIALAWSYFGRIDVIATAQGKVIPVGNVKTIQPGSRYLY
jgi:membrane fusion protein, hemolysin D